MILNHSFKRSYDKLMNNIEISLESLVQSVDYFIKNNYYNEAESMLIKYSKSKKINSLIGKYSDKFISNKKYNLALSLVEKTNGDLIPVSYKIIEEQIKNKDYYSAAYVAFNHLKNNNLAILYFEKAGYLNEAANLAYRLKKYDVAMNYYDRLKEYKNALNCAILLSDHKEIKKYESLCEIVDNKIR